MELTFVDEPSALRAALTAIDQPMIGVDVERADAPRYFRTAALIQLGTDDHAVLVDSVAMDPVPLLTDFLAERTSVLHAAENDLDPLRAVGVEVGPMHDTAVAAALLGLPTGLDPLLQKLLDVALSPHKERFQRADWEQRPLPDDMAAYAAGDVIHLAELVNVLMDRLDEAERRHWYDEELAAVRAGAFDDNRDWTRVRGAGRLSPRQRAVLRAMWEEREAIAREFDIAPNRVLREKALLDLATRPADDVQDLVRRNQRRGRPNHEHAARLLGAQQEGLDGPEEAKERAGGRWQRDQRDIYDALRKARSKRAKELGIDPGVLCPSRSLWGPARSQPDTPQQLCAAAELRGWQAEQLGEVLWATYVDVTEPADDQEPAGPVAVDAD